jgi:multiple sugar transport system ATP-binding protein
MAAVSFERVGKTYSGGTRAVHELTLEVRDGEFMVLVGPSGCGKTTALRMVAGLEEVTDGEIRIGERVVNDLEPMERDIAMVFQNYALYPHMSVYDNISYGLKVRRTPKAEIRERVTDIARILGLRDLLKRKPRQLSGGQRQRVAMGRAIVREPSVFLMDEPLSNLDAKLRVQMRAEVARIQREIGTTTIYVTHDQIEAMTMGDRVAVMRKGELQQVAPPQELYKRPMNLFVASFIGSPAMNLMEAGVERRNGGLVLHAGEQELELPAAVTVSRPELARYEGGRVALGVRPEHLHERGSPFADTADTACILRGRVRHTEALGSELLAHIEVDATPVVTEEILEVAGDIDEALAQDLVSEARQERMSLVARFQADADPGSGELVETLTSPDNFHFFDLESGLAIGVSERTGA